ncbi:MAG: hypothetical protein V4683_01450 [Bacteroidota bacterium]
MKNRLLPFLVFIIIFKSNCQNTIVGEYSFHRQEMVAGFLFEKTGKFQFFYSYGAVDRTATGSFTVKNDSLFLKSDKLAGKDFTIKSEAKKGKGYSIKVEDKNSYLVRGVRCIFFYDNGKAMEGVTDDKGEFKTDLAKVDKIYLMHPLFEDVPSQIKDEKNTNNNFVVSLNPSLGQVSFKGINFHIKDKNTITCLPNYFMNLENIKFVKQ